MFMFYEEYDSGVDYGDLVDGWSVIIAEEDGDYLFVGYVIDELDTLKEWYRSQYYGIRLIWKHHENHYDVMVAYHAFDQGSKFLGHSFPLEGL